MLFNSVEFIFLFLPVTWVGFVVLLKYKGGRLVTVWLTLTSFFFYWYWNSDYILLLLSSILVNFLLGRTLVLSDRLQLERKRLYISGVIFNIALLGYFKYTNFFIDSVNEMSGFDWDVGTIILPIGLSFFTFQQISFLKDSYLDKDIELSFFRYTTFITFFPQLIAGPIVLYKEMMPQFSHLSKFRVWPNLAIGFTIFILGLAKKVLIADPIGQIASSLFMSVEQGYHPSLFEAWGASLSYGFQIYFDFSGYADMAIGLGWMFGIKLPINFMSPYKAINITEFWRCWHMTLSRFLRDYLYIPLGGSRCSSTRWRINLLLTMLIGGLWHGAGWNFILWGGLHGFYLIIHQLYRGWIGSVQTSNIWSGRILTFVVVIIAWTPFRAESLHGTLQIFIGMAGLHGIKFPLLFAPIIDDLPSIITSIGFHGIVAKAMPSIHASTLLVVFPSLLVFVWGMPNVYQWMYQVSPVLELPGYPSLKAIEHRWFLAWSTDFRYSYALAILFFLCLMNLTTNANFIYFQF